MNGVIEALHIYDEHNTPLLSHAYTGRPLSAAQLLPLYLECLPGGAAAGVTGLTGARAPPSLVYVPATAPPTLVFAMAQDRLLFVLTATSELEPLLALEFLHRVADALEDFLGSPLLAARIAGGYDVVAQLLTELCDAGAVGTTEGNALHELVAVEGLVGKLLGSLTLPGPAGQAAAALSSSLSSSSLPPTMPALGGLSAASTALPWRRAGVRHTSNELYADVVESLAVTLAPSGRPLAARALGSIAFTSKVSGVPDIVLTLAGPARSSSSLPLALPVFHPCVRLARWREHPGTLSFIPPDGRFVLAAYEVDLLAGAVPGDPQTTAPPHLRLPISVSVHTGLGPAGADFAVRVQVQRLAGSAAAGGSQSGLGGLGGLGLAGRHAGTPAAPLLQDVHVTVPLPAGVRNLAEVRPSKGDAAYSAGERVLRWHIAARDAVAGASCSLRCTVVGNEPADDDDDNDNDDDEFGFRTTAYDDAPYQQTTVAATRKQTRTTGDADDSAEDAAVRRRRDRNRQLMPTATTVSFAVKGWLASGLRVDSMVLDTRRSRGVGEGVKPFKGVKYLTVSKEGVELRL